jgi:hypothetical protein
MHKSGTSNHGNVLQEWLPFASFLFLPLLLHREKTKKIVAINTRKPTTAINTKRRGVAVVASVRRKRKQIQPWSSSVEDRVTIMRQQERWAGHGNERKKSTQSIRGSLISTFIRISYQMTREERCYSHERLKRKTSIGTSYFLGIETNAWQDYEFDGPLVIFFSSICFF